jgi:hypothetical protein
MYVVLMRFIGKIEESKGRGKLYLCEEIMEWEMKGCVTFIFLVWFCVDFFGCDESSWY